MNAGRILCILIPDLPLLVALRVHPELRGMAVVVGGAPSEPAPVLACSGAAKRAGVRRGMRLKEAQSCCPAAIFLPAMPVELRTTIEAVRMLLEQVSPTVEAEPDGTFFLALNGLRLLWPDERRLATHTRTLLRRQGLHGIRIGIADTKYAAFIAAHNGRLCIVPPGEDTRFLQAQPVERLPAPPEMLAALRALGILSLGDFAALPQNATIMRFGGVARRLLRLARGEDDRRVLAAAPAPRLHASMSFEDPVSERERLLQAIDRRLGELHRQLEARGLAARSLRLRLRLDDRVAHESVLPLAEPLITYRQLRQQVCWHAERIELAGPVGEVEVELAGLYRLEGRQTSLFARHDSRGIRELLGEITARWGTSSLRRALLRASRRLEQGYVWDSANAPPEKDTMTEDTPPSHTAFQPHPVLRLLPEPREVGVEVEEGRPVAITLRRTSQRIVAIGGPWRLAEGWWDTPLDRDEYQFSTATGVYYVAYNRQNDTWLLLGAFD